MIRQFATLSLFALLPAFASADNQAIRQGTDLTPAQIGHAFASACATSQPSRLDRAVPLWSQAFWFAALPDTDHDFAFISPNNELKVTADVGTLKAICELHISPQIGDDGSEIYESLEAHLAEAWWRDSAVETAAIDGGVSWRYTRSDVAHIVRFVESADGFRITHIAERG
ncbi:hypothetical protein Z946_2544 [Sulfitobacter noctilucicola]|uniref:Uncharacterized protein n=1 Tax=Sulfitobacter noctilucicola TaxID=1342301 RepID=A0A7W6Q524_9RHOB|nr:hypothetical protein [Sulfitobacter noctilucicola]KIN63671.1 hypothetical protein Z946_2544 [Sulfitobacter noctilucicola]MBB4174819.1 hypothetical protein [Sulfitobacter noctilucicola]